jgi:LemA protein
MKLLILLMLLVSVTSCGLQSIPIAKNETDAQLAEVMNQYKRRTDLIPNLVAMTSPHT